MATTTATEARPWEIKLRETAALYRSSLEENNLDAYFEVQRSAFGVDLKSLNTWSFQKPEKAYSLKLESDDERERLKSLGKQLIEDHQTAANDVKATSDAIKNGSTGKENARVRMEKAREEAKKKSAEIIDQQFDRAQTLIDQLPDDKQEAATDFWIQLSNGFLAFWKIAMDAIYAVLKAVIDWLENMWETVKQRWEDVKATFKDAWEWFQALFN
ncbi:hypothetical protein NXS19_000155 [Fusarium pseudograminearum]|uniref:Uncharacterized protein n=1 Tax=Fusarium pseudograminearum (strain CS3096) TaxID=1028729 RepID=K3V8S7_FUSPC|nr:hypothetical protein FPSE_10050 [Fusarium pseudograminearum CS3096]EKJ69734.1 hypothetical protein FPSE_10050 [Fusarium pseudograminearum CS3096]UZP32339.1 hypothetical protein NXS19_000155 [Fusarium pseudograminearum]